MTKLLSQYDPRPADMSGPGSGVKEWADKWGPIIGKGMVEAETRLAERLRAEREARG